MTMTSSLKLSRSLERRLVDLGFVILGGVAVWFVTQRLLGKAWDAANDKAAELTESPANLIAELKQWWNGSPPVELTPLMIRDFYLTDEYRLTPDAEATLWNWQPWHPVLIQMFGERGGVMKERYRPLINKEIDFHV